MTKTLSRVPQQTTVLRGDVVMHHLRESMLHLIELTVTTLPYDVFNAIDTAYHRERSSGLPSLALSMMRANAIAAMQYRSPMCEDTGVATFYVRCGNSCDRKSILSAIYDAVSEATAKGLLRQSCIDSVTGESSPNNIGAGFPIVHFEDNGTDEEIEVRLLLKGAGSENQSRQYSLPCELEGVGLAERNLNGVLKCILHSVYMAQGFGCSPGFLGVCIGGERASGYEWAKRQLLRALNDENADERLRELERNALKLANELGIGPLGFGGECTLLSCKIGKLHRHPASFFVSVAYMCWAYRRHGVVIDARSGEIKRMLYEPSRFEAPAELIIPHSVKELSTPLSDVDVKGLKVGDVVKVSGEIFTGRDRVHMRLARSEAPVDMRGGIIYHCGPLAVREGDEWKILAAGPTTSIRHEPYQACVIEKHGLRAVIGKGGMGEKTRKALSEHGAVYLHAIGGAAKLYADCVEAVEGVWWLDEFGSVEAMWKLRVKDFIAVVTMDAYGNSLHEKVRNHSYEKLKCIASSLTQNEANQ
ncbi:MAG: hypothetical protein RUDDFDWM_001888 [Candidatus Fervidibacterota bacterium]